MKLASNILCDDRQGQISPAIVLWSLYLARNRRTVDVRDVADFLMHLAATEQSGIFNAVGNSSTTGEYIETVRKVTGGAAPVT